MSHTFSFPSLQKPMVEYLHEIQCVEEDDKLPDLIPDQILLQHLVALRQVLRKYVAFLCLHRVSPPCPCFLFA